MIPVPGETPLATAIRYAATRMKKLDPWLDHGIAELDNNAADRVDQLCERCDIECHSLGSFVALKGTGVRSGV